MLLQVFQRQVSAQPPRHLYDGLGHWPLVEAPSAMLRQESERLC
jgi:hypothetical protein